VSSSQSQLTDLWCYTHVFEYSDQMQKLIFFICIVLHGVIFTGCSQRGWHALPPEIEDGTPLELVVFPREFDDDEVALLDIEVTNHRPNDLVLRSSDFTASLNRRTVPVLSHYELTTRLMDERDKQIEVAHENERRRLSGAALQLTRASIGFALGEDGDAAEDAMAEQDEIRTRSNLTVRKIRERSTKLMQTMDREYLDKVLIQPESIERVTIATDLGRSAERGDILELGTYHSGAQRARLIYR
jgi:hypothetical protein